MSSETGNIFPKNAPEQLIKMTPVLNGVNDELNRTFEIVKKLNEQLNQNNISFEKLSAAQKKAEGVSKELNTVEAQLAKTEIKLKQLEDERQKSIAANKVAILAKNKALKDTAKLEAANSKVQKENIVIAKAQRGAYDAITAALTKNVAKWKSLTAAERDNTTAGKKLTATIKQQDTELKSLDKQLGRSQRSVGSYRDALKGIATQLFAGLGVVAGIRAFVGILKSSFASISQFDAAMQNIAGIAGTSREKLVDVEKAIKDVAGESVKTSNEVAKLAEVLFTLGKTKEEVIQMLAPVNNLAIGLQTTSENAAELLGQTLNAFGKGSESAAEFADIIANMRTSTALNFERIQDALGFLAPTASALNLTLGDTGALIGILQDNGVKASRAGALLNTSFARLVGQGLTLEDALVKINNSTDKVGTSSELFGKRAFGLGLILADNTDKIKTLGSEFDNLSSGSLKKLTDEQLKSISAQTKIASSVWEKWILSIDSGNGVISRVVKNSIKLFIDLFTPIKTATEAFVEQKEKIKDLEKNISPLLDRYDELKTKTKLNKEEQIELNTIVGKIGESLPTVITQWDKYGKAIDISTDAGRRAIEVIQRQNELLNVDAIKEQEKQLSKYDKTIESLNSQLEGGTKTISVYMGQFGGTITEEIALTGDEIVKLSNDLNNVQLSKEATQATINGLKGIKEEVIEVADTSEKAGTELTSSQQTEADKRIKIAEKESKARVQAIIDRFDAERDYKKQQGIDEKSFEEEISAEIEAEQEKQDKLVAIDFEATQEKLKNSQQLAEERTKLDDEAEEERISRIEFFAQAAGAISDTLFDRKIANIQKEFDVLMLQKEAELSNENLSAAQKQAIEEKYAKKAAEIKTKQAKAEKRAALIGVLINTSLAVSKAFGQTGIFGIAASIPIIAMGVLQSALIASQPIPEFADGIHTNSGTPNDFIAGEAGRERMTLKSGQIMMVDKPTHFKGNKYKGATIDSNAETERILSQAGSNNNFVFDTEELKRENKKNTTRIVKAINRDNYRQNKRVSNAYKNQFL